MYSKLPDNPIPGHLSDEFNAVDYCVSFTDQTRDGVLLIDQNGLVIFWNTAMESILGISKADALNLPIWKIYNILPGEETDIKIKMDMVQQEITQAVKTGKADWLQEMTDHAIMLPDGSRKYLQAQCFPIPHVQSFMIGCIIRDITREKEAVDQLRHEQVLLQSIIQNVHEIIFTFTLEGEFTFMSTGWIGRKGYKVDEVTGRLFSDFMHPDDIENSWKAVGEVIKTRRSVNDIEFRALRKDGSYGWYLSSATLVQDHRGKPSFIIGIATDITERKKMEAALRDSEARLRLIQNNMTDIVLQSDMNGIYLYASPSYERLFGYICTPGVSSIFDYIHPDDLDRVHAAIQDGLDGCDLVCVEYRHQVKDHGYIWLESLGSVLRDNEGNPTGLQVTSRDITKRRLYQERLEYINVHDVLTGLYNRTYFEEQIKRMETGRFDPLSVIAVDSDGLKQVNDKLGHLAGDTLLQTIADLLRLSFRDSDIIARVGGDEFFIICPSCGQGDIEALIERLQNTITTYNLSGPPVPVCLSIGYAVRNDSSTAINEVLRQADAVMYEQKAANRRESRRLFAKAGLG